ncbi:MAG: glycosyltransferase [Rhodobacteraceae bacterium]|nr:glycosyltransferase [Paracoccaceae bacterium]
MPPPPIRLVTRTELARSTPRATADGAAEQSAPTRKPLGQILTDRGLLSKENLNQALDLQDRWDARLGDILCAEHDVTRDDIRRAVAQQHDLPFIDPGKDTHDPMLVRQYGVARCLSDQCLPWRRVGARTVILVDAPARFERLQRQLTAVFGPVIMGLSDGERLHYALSRLHRRELRERAETRVAEEDSCRDWRGQAFSRALATLIVILVVGALVVHEKVLIAVTAWAMFTLIAVTLLKLTAALAGGQHRPSRAARILNFSEGPSGWKLPVVTCLVPLLREDEIAGGLIRNLSRLRYPSALLDICLVVEADDRHTLRTLGNTHLPEGFRVVKVPAGELRTKPRALNYSLDFARGSIIGVYDAEDAPEPDQIDRVVAHFNRADPWVACLQGALDFYNRRQSWLTRCFTLDYAVWFRAVLPGLSRMRLPLPLGGTTLFFRRGALEALGAWDAHNVTEDADLGLRLARAGYRTELIPTVTREQATSGTIAWIRQRSRWLKGYAMTYAVHMRNPVQLWRDLGTRGFLAVQVLFLGTISQYTLAPVLWSWWLVAFGLPHPVADVLPGGWLIAVVVTFVLCELISIGVGMTAARRAGCLTLAPWLLTMTFYHMLATVASFKALAEMVSRPFYWDKTHHPDPVMMDEDAVPTRQPPYV